MNKLLILLLLLCSLNSFGQLHGKRVTNQRLLQPNTSFIQYPVLAGSKGVYSFAGCGTPDTAVSIPENAQGLTTTYLDTCTGTTWQYNPSAGGYWDTLSGGGGNVINYYAQGNGSFTDTVKAPTYGDKLEIKIYTPGRIISGLSTATKNGSGFSNKWYSDADTLHIFYSFGPIDTVYYILSGYIVDTAVLIPPTPTGLVQDAHDILWSWNTVPHASAYYMEYTFDNSHDYIFLGETTDTMYLHSGIPPDTYVKFRVRAEGDTAWYGSNFGYASARTDTLVALATPSITAIADSTTITVDWDPIAHAIGYKVFFSNDGVDYALADSVGAGVTSYVFDSLSTNTQIWLKVQGVGDGNVYDNSDYSDTVSATTYMLPQIATPNLIIDSTTTNAAYMHWNGITGAVNYLIQYRTDTTDFQLAGETSAGTLVFVHNNLSSNTHFVWRLQAIADNTTHSNSNFDVDSATTQVSLLQALQTPIPAATAVSPNRINVSYTNVANEIAYVFEISTDSAAWTVIDTLNANITTSFATNLKANTRYILRVKALANGIDYQNSAYGFTSISTLQLTVLAANTITATTTGTNSIRVNVTSNTHASGYQIEYSTDNGATYTIADTITGLVFTHQPLNEKTLYKYRDKVLGDSITYGNSAYSNIASATTDSTVIVAQTLAAPTGLNSVANSTTQITTTWNPVTSASYYQVERSTNKTSWTASPQVAAGTTTITIGSLPPNTKIYIRIYAGGNGTTTLNSPYSAIDSVTTNALIVLATPALTATNIDATSNNLSWTASANASFYTLRYSLNKTTWTTISTANVRAFIHQNLNPQTKYYYETQANGNGTTYANSAFDLDSATTPALPPTPLNTPTVTLSVFSFSRLDGSWSAIPNAAGYKVDRSTNGSTWTNVATLAANVTTYSLTGLQPATTYWMRVQATATGTVYSNSDYGVASATTTDTSTTPITLLNGAMLNGGSVNAAKTALNNLGITLIRTAYDGNGANYPAYTDQYQTLWNYNPQRPGDGLPMPTDSGQYACTLDSMLTENGTHNLIGIAIINEPVNVGYWTTNISASNYLRLLQACVNVGQRRGIPVYDGGFSGNLTRYEVWWDYTQRGLTDSANSFAALAFDKGTNLSGWRTSSNYAARIKFLDTLIANISKIGTAAVNIHYYETVRDADSNSTVELSEEALIETAHYYSRVGKKPVITNEYGMNNTSNVNVQTGLLKALKKAGFRIALYYGPDVLMNPDGSLTPLGNNYKNVIKQ
jgi:hypothetical protein